MESWFLEDILFRIAVPKLFASAERGGPFTHCIDCSRDLRAPGNHYLVEKAFRGSETTHEFALCLRCHESLSDRVSAESRARIDALFLTNGLGILRRDIRIREATADRRSLSDPGPSRGSEPRHAPRIRRGGRPGGGCELPADEIDASREPGASILLGPWVDRCILRNTPEVDCRERTIIGVCDGPDLLVGTMPWMMSFEALDQIHEAMSRKTRDELDRWKEDVLGTPPELEELLRSPRAVLI